MKRIEIYRSDLGKAPFERWLEQLDSKTQTVILAYVHRVALGLSKKNIRSLGSGVFEIKINQGAGFRVYFGEVGNVVILLLLGGDKGSQSRDIRKAQSFWRDYVSK